MPGKRCLLRTALALTINELVTILKIVVARDRFGDVVAWIQWRTVQRFNQTDLVSLITVASNSRTLNKPV